MKCKDDREVKPLTNKMWKCSVRDHRLFLLLEGDAVDGQLLHCRLTDTHVCDHGLHLCSLAL